MDPAQQVLIEHSRARLATTTRGRDREWWSRWVGAAAYIGTALTLLEALPTRRETHYLVLILLTIGYAAACRVQFEVGSGVVVPTEFVFVAMLFSIPAREVPTAVVIGMVLCRIPELVRRTESFGSIAATIGSGWFSLGPVAVVAALHEPAAASSRWPLLFLLVGVQFATDFVTTAVREWAAISLRPSQLVSAMGLALSVDIVLAPIGFLAAMSGSIASLAAPLLLLSLIARFASERQQAIDGAMELGRAYRGTAFLLGDVVEADDAYTGAHSRDVVELSLAVSDRLGLGARDRQAVELVALLHDVGKIRIPNEIIRKNGPLNADEWALIETHTIEGERLLVTVGGLLAEVGHIVRSCHERWDGGGYPDRLSGDQIPLVARIICCCDAFNAMTTDRPYRQARSVGEAITELQACSGTQFDPAVAEVLLQLLEAGTS